MDELTPQEEELLMEHHYRTERALEEEEMRAHMMEEDYDYETD